MPFLRLSFKFIYFNHDEDFPGLYRGIKTHTYDMIIPYRQNVKKMLRQEKLFYLQTLFNLSVGFLRSNQQVKKSPISFNRAYS